MGNAWRLELEDLIWRSGSPSNLFCNWAESEFFMPFLLSVKKGNCLFCRLKGLNEYLYEAFDKLGSAIIIT